MTISTAMTSRYPVVLEQSEEGYAAHCPALPGCWSQWQSEKEALENIRIAISEYLSAIIERLSPSEIREVEVSLG